MSRVGGTTFQSLLELSRFAFILADRFTRCSRRGERDGGEESGGRKGDEGESHCWSFRFGLMWSEVESEEASEIGGGDGEVLES